MAVSTNSAAERCRFGLFEFDGRTGELSREGRLIKLAPQPARVLARLLERPGELVLRDELRDLVWGQDTFVDFERGLNFCILQVRTALGDSSENPRFVQTVPRKGYRFIAPVAPVAPVAPIAPITAAEAPLSAPAPAPAPPPAPAALSHNHLEPAAAHPRTPGRITPRHLWLTLPLLVTIGALLWVLGTRATAPAPANAPTPIRLVVLPVASLMGSIEGDLLADGLTDTIIAELGQLSPRQLAVIARTSAMTYKKAPRPVADIGRELNVSYVVETSLRREHGALRVNSQVVSVADQTPRASLSELFGGDPSAESSETTLALRVSRFVAGALLPEPADPGTPGNPASAAWNAYVRGRALLHRGTLDDVQRALAEFASATASDPALAAAWAATAEAHHLRVMIGVARPLDAYPAARAAADRAKAADPHASTTHLADGLVTLWFDQRPKAAAAAFERAITINGSSAAAHHDYAWALLALGRDNEAIAEITAARDLDPLSARANTDIGWLYLHLNRPADAERACLRTLTIQREALEPQACLERAYAARGLWEPALQAAGATMPADAFARATAGQRNAQAAVRAVWRWRLEHLENAAATGWVSPYTLAVQHALVGNTAAAIEQLARGRQERVGMLLFLARDPALDTIRSDPRFTPLMSAPTR